ncbi:ESX secretion-associated protein EspG [Sciscionella sediminilitoris]|uniref:ESX secretion-associated protein EspG n=1 Tax=Sciscionella sediminilitoris TaxID=1445613 RepID=UPI0004DF024D|nr:ESX secretion-associated protein EspG [Sciscionella sp. SE31]
MGLTGERSALRGAVSGEALHWVLERYGIGELHPVVAPERYWYADSERHTAETEWRQELIEAGICDRYGELSERTARLLLLLTRPAVEFSVFLGAGSLSAGLLIAGRGADAVVAKRIGAQVELDTIANEYLAERLHEQLPEVAPGRGSATVRLDTLVAGESDPDLRRLQRIAGSAQPCLLAEVYAGARDGLGGYRRTEQGIQLRDTERGRWIVKVENGYLSLFPGSRTAVLENLHRLADSVQA